MIDDDTEEQAEEEIIESIDAIPDENDELGQVSVAMTKKSCLHLQRMTLK